MNKYEQIKDILLDEYESDRLKHAYIFESSNIDKAIEMADFISKKIMDTDDLSRISDYKSIEKEDMNIATIRDIIKNCVIKPYKEKKKTLSRGRAEEHREKEQGESLKC